MMMMMILFLFLGAVVGLLIAEVPSGLGIIPFGLGYTAAGAFRAPEDPDEEATEA
jgi:hypothetical protein